MEKSNSYIFVYSLVLVVLIAALLSVAAFSLKPAQQANIKIEKMQNILNAVKIETETSEAETVFNEKLKDFFFVKKGTAEVATAESIKQTDMFNLQNDGENLPVYEVEGENDTYFVIPLNGAGLWGPIWGYISIAKSDCSTILGTVFDHASETAGLGAEIVKPKFRDRFEGKHIFKDGEFTSVKVMKGGATNDYNEIDAISGSTKTCDGVTNMLNDCLSGYATYFLSVAGGVVVQEPVADSVATPVADTLNVESLN